jgi:hypothetical protein
MENMEHMERKKTTRTKEECNEMKQYGSEKRSHFLLQFLLGFENDTP